jgi:protein phosphatase
MATTFATATHTGLVRRGNEDSYFARPPVFAVADGMGGAAAGEVASAMAVRSFEYFLPQSSRPDEELAKLVGRINESIYQYAAAGHGPAGMGTTITAATLSGGAVGIAHVGDSRAWLLRGGELTRLTQDHSLVAEMLREGQITEAEAATHPQRSIITRALGVEPAVKVDRYTVEWQPGDIFLLASDGLHGMVPEEDIGEILSSGKSLPEMADELIEAANSRGGNDNVTVVLFSPDGSVPGHERGDIPAGAVIPAENAPPSWPQRISNLAHTVPGYIIIGLLISVLVLGAAWGATRFAYYVGVEGEAVTLFRGIPYEIGPVSLSSRQKSSPVKFSELEPYWVDRVNALQIQSKSGAQAMFDNIIVSDRERKAEEEAEKKRKQQELEAGNKANSPRAPGAPVEPESTTGTTGGTGSTGETP